MSALIPYPDVPLVPGVPQVPRLPSVTPVGVGAIPTQTVGVNLANSSTIQARWGIYNADGTSLFDLNRVSVKSFTMTADSVVADFPVEAGKFADYDKVIKARTPVLTLTCSGSLSDRLLFLNTLEAARQSVTTYTILTSEQTLQSYNIQNYNYSRDALSGVGLLTVRVSLMEVRTVTAQYTQKVLVNSPSNPNDTPQVSSGTVQLQPVSPMTADQWIG